jgi:hypothetical protein
MKLTLGNFGFVLDSLYSYGSNLRGGHHFPSYNIFLIFSWRLYLNDYFSWKSQIMNTTNLQNPIFSMLIPIEEFLTTKL